MIYCQRKETKQIDFFGDLVFATVTAEIEHLMSNKDAYFSITVSGKDFGGCKHDMVRREWPHLAPFIKWHLTGTRTGPMHYVANACYWAGFGKYSDHNEEHLKAHIVYGAAEGDTEVDPMALTEDELIAWLKERFSSLMSAFDQDMRAIFGDQYQIKQQEQGS